MGCVCILDLKSINISTLFVLYMILYFSLELMQHFLPLRLDFKKKRGCVGRKRLPLRGEIYYFAFKSGIQLKFYEYTGKETQRYICFLF